MLVRVENRPARELTPDPIAQLARRSSLGLRPASSK
jgi:hypothetical protein